MPPRASRCCPCTTPSPTTAASNRSPATTSLGWGPAARAGIRAAAKLASTPSAPSSRTGSPTPPVTRARVLAWWTRQPQANVGLVTGHAFDVLDVDGPTGEAAIRELAATHGLQSSGPLVRTGGGGWHFYLAPTGLGNANPQGLEHVDWRGRGGYVVAPPSRHASGHPYQWLPGRDLDTPPGQVPAVLLERLERRPPQRPAGPLQLAAVGDGPGHRYARAALATELARVATAPVGQRNRQLWEAARNLYNLVATGALPEPQAHQGLLDAAERCGLLGDEPRQTRRTLASARQVGLAHPRALPTRQPPAAPAAPPPSNRTQPQRAWRPDPERR
jgi:hypothetical protein